MIAKTGFLDCDFIRSLGEERGGAAHSCLVFIWSEEKTVNIPYTKENRDLLNRSMTTAVLCGNIVRQKEVFG